MMTNKTEKIFYTIMAIALSLLSLVQLHLHNIEKSFTLCVLVLMILRVIALLEEEK